MPSTDSTFRSTKPSTTYPGGLTEGVLETLRTVHIDSGGVDLTEEGRFGPSSTWTYMIDDNPMGDVFDRLTRGIKRFVKRQS